MVSETQIQLFLQKQKGKSQNPKLNVPSWVSTCVVGMTVAVGVGVGTVAGVIMGLMLALGVGLFPGLTGCLLAEATGVGLMLAVGVSDVLALIETKIRT